MNPSESDPFPGAEPQDAVIAGAVTQKLVDALLGAIVIEFTPEEAELAGAFEEHALDELAAAAAPVEPRDARR